MNIEEDEYLAHYGILRKSGRYPWGSGENENLTQSQRNKKFLEMVKDLEKQGFSEPDICRAFQIGRIDKNGNFLPSTGQLRAAKTIAKDELKREEIATARRLKDKHMSNVAIGEQMGRGESYVRTLLAEDAEQKASALMATSEMLKRAVDEKGFIDVGSGVEKYVRVGEGLSAKVGVSAPRLNAAVSVLKEQGYELHTNIKVKQLGTGHETTLKVLCPPGTTWGDVQRNRDKIQQIQEFSTDNGLTFGKFRTPIAVDPKRVQVRYAEDGGAKEDGVLYVRPGAKDLSLGKNRYAQVRVQVGDGHYLKGMAVLKDDLPPGVDIQFNTNKSNTGNKLDAMKKLKDDPDLPFGSVVRQLKEFEGTDKERVISAMNLVNEEGDWNDWSRTLSTQFLSKQSPALIREQLNATYNQKKADYDEIMSLQNPTVRRKLLESYADSTDAAAVHLKAAKLPRQASQVILPINSIKPTEVYAPNYNHGEKVMLVRFPHGGKFEIPELIVNNNNREGKKIIGPKAIDAIGIHHTVAERLSGADFDGDTVLVLPNNNNRVKNAAPLQQLKNFDAKREYAPYHGMKTMDGGTWDANKKEAVFPPGKKPSSRQTGIQMGLVSNLITDMTLRAAPNEHIARAVKHSMVVIDAEKHHLDYKRSAEENGIRELYTKYSSGPGGGANSLISKATSETRIPEYKPRPAAQGGPIDKATGKLVYVPTGRTKQNGDLVKVKAEKLAITDDAFTLLSKDGGTPVERTYATHSNQMKALANRARLSLINTPRLERSPSAAKAYAKEVATLDAKLTLALMNSPRERQAQIVANAIVRQRLQNNPDLEESTRKKLEYQELETARTRMRAKKAKIEITPDEWKAIQAGAISDTKLETILNNADLDIVKALATPRAAQLMTTAKTDRAMDMLANGATRAQVAATLGISISTLDEAIKGS